MHAAAAAAAAGVGVGVSVCRCRWLHTAQCHGRDSSNHSRRKVAASTHITHIIPSHTINAVITFIEENLLINRMLYITVRKPKNLRHYLIFDNNKMLCA